MGNILHGASNDMHFPYHVQLGKHATIDINETKICNPNLPNFDLRLNMSYTVDGSKCFLEFNRKFENCKIEMVTFVMVDTSSNARVQLTITKLEFTDNLYFPTVVPSIYKSIQEDTLNCVESENTSRTNKLGVVTETIVIAYGSGSKGGVRELQTNLRET
jgi:hypothetical protein